jgi:hypothetical protein
VFDPLLAAGSLPVSVRFIRQEQYKQDLGENADAVFNAITESASHPLHLTPCFL